MSRQPGADSQPTMSAEETAEFTRREQATTNLNQLATDSILEQAESVDDATSVKAHKGHEWQPGESGNPSGRSKSGKSLASLTATLEKVIDRTKLAKALWSMATDEQYSPSLRLDATKYIYSRIEGLPLQAMRHTTGGQLVPLIFLHPGRPQDVIEADVTPLLDTDSASESAN